MSEGLGGAHRVGHLCLLACFFCTIQFPPPVAPHSGGGMRLLSCKSQNPHACLAVDLKALLYRASQALTAVCKTLPQEKHPGTCNVQSRSCRLSVHPVAVQSVPGNLHCWVLQK